MRRFALMMVLPLAACASVEERTDARSGSGFSAQSIAGAQAPQAMSRTVTLAGMEPVPAVALSGTAADREMAAAMALDAGGSEEGVWTSVTSGSDTYAMRQVSVGAFQFAVADPDGRAGATQGLLLQTEVRTGCKTTGRTWSDDGLIALAIDCS